MKPPPSSYANLEIRIFEKQGERGYPVELTVENQQGKQEFPRGYLSADVPDTWIFNEVAPAQSGRELLDHLLSDAKIRDGWQRAWGQSEHRRVRLRIDPTAPELHPIPWEVLHYAEPDKAAVALAATATTPFSRYLADTNPAGEPVTDRPLRLLVAIAAPDLDEYENLAAVKPALEKEILQTALAGVPSPDLEVTYLDGPVTLPAIEKALRDGYHMLHMIAHGRFNPKKEIASLCLADDDNEVRWTKTAEFVEMLNGLTQKPRLIFLASCQSATRSPTDAFRGFAPALVREAGIPAVLAMQELVPMDTAREFTAAFYPQLLKHGLVDLASNEARAAVHTADLSGGRIPVLFSRLPDNRLFDIPQIQIGKPRLSYEPKTVLIPAGPFLLGSDEGQANQAPRHQVDLPAFEIGRYPVTVKEFATFIEDTGQVVPSLGWPGQKPAEAQEKLPVTGVTWYLALAYCTWLSQKTGRTYALPTEAEWEKAARGPDGYRYPWGDEWLEGRCNADPGQIKPVDAYAPQSIYGGYDIVGNAREWTCSLWGSQPRRPETRFAYPQTHDQIDQTWRPDSPRHNLTANSQMRRIYRGGAGSTPDQLRCTIRKANMPETRLDLHRHGLRVVRREE